MKTSEDQTVVGTYSATVVAWSASIAGPSSDLQGALAHQPVEFLGSYSFQSLRPRPKEGSWGTEPQSLTSVL